MNYKKYAGNSFVKRFYTKFEKENIFKILDFRHGVKFPVLGEFLYSDGGANEWWADVEDSVIITNEHPISDDERVANINDPQYNGYNPFENKSK